MLCLRQSSVRFSYCSPNDYSAGALDRNRNLEFPGGLRPLTGKTRPALVALEIRGGVLETESGGGKWKKYFLWFGGRDYF